MMAGGAAWRIDRAILAELHAQGLSDNKIALAMGHAQGATSKALRKLGLAPHGVKRVAAPVARPAHQDGLDPARDFLRARGRNVTRLRAPGRWLVDDREMAAGEMLALANALRRQRGEPPFKVARR